jgi:hypothetical protein
VSHDTTYTGTDIQELRTKFEDWCQAQCGLVWTDHILIEIDDDTYKSHDNREFRGAAQVEVAIKRIQLAKTKKQWWNRDYGETHQNYGHPISSVYDTLHKTVIPWNQESWDKLAEIVKRIEMLYDQIKEFIDPKTILENLAKVQMLNMLPAPPAEINKENQP